MTAVYAFEPDGGSEDALLTPATLWNSNLLVEAQRIEDDDPTPVPSVRGRLDRRVRAAGAGPKLTTVRLPGHDGSCVLFTAAPG